MKGRERESFVFSWEGGLVVEERGMYETGCSYVINQKVRDVEISIPTSGPFRKGKG